MSKPKSWRKKSCPSFLDIWNVIFRCSRLNDFLYLVSYVMCDDFNTLIRAAFQILWCIKIYLVVQNYAGPQRIQYRVYMNGDRLQKCSSREDLDCVVSFRRHWSWCEGFNPRNWWPMLLHLPKPKGVPILVRQVGTGLSFRNHGQFKCQRIESQSKALSKSCWLQNDVFLHAFWIGSGDDILF